LISDLIGVCLHDSSADLTALLSVRRKDVFSVQLGFVDEEMMAVSTQNVLGYHTLHQKNHQLTPRGVARIWCEGGGDETKRK